MKLHTFQSSSFFCRNCLITTYENLEVISEVSLFGLSFLVSGLLYGMVCITLTTSRFSTRKRTLTIAMVLLWLTLCSLPYLILHLNFKINHKYSRHAVPSDFSDYMEYEPRLWQESENRVFVYKEIGFRALKQSYSFVNSILLIVLLRPFHRPICWVFNFPRHILSTRKNK